MLYVKIYTLRESYLTAPLSDTYFDKKKDS